MTTTEHVVLVAWKSGQQARAEEAVRPAIRDFRHTIPDVVAVAEGHSSSPEGLENGYDYGFIVTFASAEARDTYLSHPSHLPVAQAIGEAAAQIVVFDI